MCIDFCECVCAHVCLCSRCSRSFVQNYIFGSPHYISRGKSRTTHTRAQTHQTYARMCWHYVHKYEHMKHTQTYITLHKSIHIDDHPSQSSIQPACARAECAQLSGSSIQCCVHQSLQQAIVAVIMHLNRSRRTKRAPNAQFVRILYSNRFNAHIPNQTTIKGSHLPKSPALLFARHASQSTVTQTSNRGALQSV